MSHACPCLDYLFPDSPFLYALKGGTAYAKKTTTTVPLSRLPTSYGRRLL